MKITSEMVDAILSAAERLGGVAALGRACGINNSTIGKYCKGVIRTVTDEKWELIYPHVRDHLPRGESCKPRSQLLDLPMDDASEIVETILDIEDECQTLDEAAHAEPGEGGDLTGLCGMPDDSMSPRIQKGDIVVALRGKPIGDGDVVLAKHGGKVQIRRYRLVGSTEFLDCTNPAWRDTVAGPLEWKLRVMRVVGKL